MSKPKINDTVDIINKNFSGRFIYEGSATVVSEENRNGHYDVEFENGDRVTRYVDMEAQGRVEQYLEELNQLWAKE